MPLVERPIKTAILGLNKQGWFHFDYLKILPQHFQLVAIQNSEKSINQLSQQSEYQFYTHWEELLQDSKIELVIITGPHEFQVDQILAALQAGKHVLVEPPGNLSSEQVQHIIQLAQKSQKQLQLWQPKNLNADFLTATQLVQSGSLGKLISARFLTHHLTIVSQSAHKPSSLVGKYQTLFDYANPFFFQLSELFAQRPLQVFAQISELTDDSDPQAGITLFVDFQEGATALIELKLFSTVSWDTGWILTGTKAGYRNFQQFSATTEGEIFSTPLAHPQITATEVYQNLWQDLIQAVHSRKKYQQFLDVVSLTEAVIESAHQRCVVPVKLAELV